MTCTECQHPADEHGAFGCRNVDPYDGWRCRCSIGRGAVAEAVATELPLAC